MSFIKNVIQANLTELNDLILQSDESINQNDILYAKALKAYLRGDIAELKGFSKQENQTPVIKLILEIRVQIKEFKIDKSKLIQLENLVSSLELSHTWKSECFFILGLAWCEISSFEKSKECYLISYRLLWANDIKKKAVKSLLNYVVSESRLCPDKRLILDYEMVCDKALEINDEIVVGICKLNIAREYRLIGGYDLALKFINQSVDNLKKDKGVNHYYYALLERCLIYLDMKQFNKAYLDYQVIQESNLTDISETLIVIKNRLGHEQDLKTSYLDPVWIDCLKDIRDNIEVKSLTKMEMELIEHLSHGALAKFQLIERIYGVNLAFDSADNRFKVLLSRLRKKLPGIILFSNELYELSEKSYLGENSIKVS